MYSLRVSLEPHIFIAIRIPWLLSELYWYHSIGERTFNMHRWKRRRPQTANLLKKIKELYYLRKCWSWKSGRNKCKPGNSIFLWIGAGSSRDWELGKGTQRSTTETALAAVKTPLPVSQRSVTRLGRCQRSPCVRLGEASSYRGGAQLCHCALLESLITSVPIAVWEMFGYYSPASMSVFSCKDMPRYKFCIYLDSFRKYFSSSE